MLVKGYKFDMRIYVLVTSVKPLEAFVYKEVNYLFLNILI